MAKTLKGIAASRGIGIAPAFILIERPLTISHTKTNDKQAEIKKFKTAVQETLATLKQLETKTQKTLGDEKAQIFIAHQQIASDPALESEVTTLINKEGYNAAWAVDTVTKKFQAVMAAMDNEYFKERAADIRDVALRMIKLILGIKIIDLATMDEPAIIVADELTPSQTAQMNSKVVKGFVCDLGGKTSHVAIMAQSLMIPAVVGIKKKVTEIIKTDDQIIIDGTTGEVIINPSPAELKTWTAKQKAEQEERAELQQFKSQPSISKDRHQVFIEANIGSPADLEGVVANGAEGVGLFRTEFLYMDNDHFPTEDEQFEAYKTVLEKMGDKLVVIRTLDIGGDKSLPYYKFPEEMNPFLGHRAIRFCLANKKIFKTQLRALYRASAFGNLAIMFPMIAVAEEFKAAKAIALECAQELKAEKVAIGKKVQLGMMVEIPAAALQASMFADPQCPEINADFFSIGTNDLIQYTMAADRGNDQVAYLYQPCNPAILNLVAMTIKAAHQHGKWVGMCGEMAADPIAAPILLGLGLDYFSMSAPSILPTRKLISSLNYQSCQALAQQALTQPNTSAVIDLVNQFHQTEKQK